jgi:epoxyqueuosine reductase
MSGDASGMEERIRAHALKAGASLIGFAPATAYPEYVQEVTRRIAERHIVVEDYLSPAKDGGFPALYEDPRCTLPSARSVVLIGVNAFDDACSYTAARGELRGKIARTYAYYPVIRKIAETVAALLRDELGFEAVQSQNFPLKLTAAGMGLGSYGENGVILTREYGSFVALSGVLTSASLASESSPPEDLCQHCGKCRKACPTGALYEPYKVDPSLCVNAVARKSAEIPEHLRRKIGAWFRGCDICQDVCPRNHALVPRAADPRCGYDPAFHSSHALLDDMERLPRLMPLLDEDRPPLIRRNAAIVLGNIGRGQPELLQALRRHAGKEKGELKAVLSWALAENGRRGKGQSRGTS